MHLRGRRQKKKKVRGRTRKALCYMRTMFQVFEILQSNEERELEKLLTKLGSWDIFSEFSREISEDC